MTMKAIYSQAPVNAFLKIMKSSKASSAHRRLATLSQSGTFSSSIGFPSNIHDSWFREREPTGEGEVCDHRTYGYRTVSPRRGRSYATSAKTSIDHLPALLSLVHTSTGQHFYQDEYSFIMASHCPVSAEQCEKIRQERALVAKESSSPAQDLTNNGLVQELAGFPMDDSRVNH